VTTLVHGADAAAAAIAASEALFGQGDLSTLDAATLASALRELPHAELAAGTPVVSALVDTGLVTSLGEARRAIAQGGVSLDGVKVDDDAAVITGSLPGGVSVLRRGKKTLAGVFVRG
jgi:tyrosyl-tRNA synthetase